MATEAERERTANLRALDSARTLGGRLASSRGRKHASNFSREPLNALGHIGFTAHFEELSGDLKRCQNRGALRVAGPTRFHDPLDRLIKIRGDRARVLRRLVAANCVFLAHDRDTNDVLFRAPPRPPTSPRPPGPPR